MTHRKGHPRSRALPDPIDPGLPPHLRDIALTAMIGTINAPIGASMPAIFLASAKALIDAAIVMERRTRGGFERVAMPSTDAAWLESRPFVSSDFMKADGR